MQQPADWLLGPGERGNAATRLEHRRPDGAAWSRGNQVRPLVHGTVYFAELLHAIRAQQAGDLLLFTDWRGDPDEPLGDPARSDSEIGKVLCAAAERGVIVKSLIWRSHLDRLQFSESENRHLGEEIGAAFADAAADLDAWHAGGRTGPRPPGRLRAYRDPHLSRTAKLLATPLYRFLADPDGRPLAMRHKNAY
ncbi:hypothetical protein EDD99_6176 [Streptomyces sp. 846.5]|nr:hypothetical protein [Streptomyces sp. 846.5]TDT97969.1 hypothetical protein EDD99_6176 [Streptomyces sp. 846.5]